MITYALIGEPLGHSFSQRYFTQRFASLHLANHRYLLAPILSLDGLRQRAADEQWRGFNVTIPYKQAILPLLDSISPEAQAIGAVNCVKINAQGQWIGYNTDAPAFRDTLFPLLKEHHREALLFGTGGASKAVAYVLQQMGIDYLQVSRQPKGPHQIAYSEVPQWVDTHLLLINATPLGTVGSFEGLSPLPSSLSLSERHLCYDLVYNPTPTPFLAQAARQGASVQGGLPMLYRQADLSWELWNTL